MFIVDKVYLLHAYSPLNSGDGLLVKLSLDVISRQCAAPVVVVCIDPASFKGYLKGRNCVAIGLFHYVLMLLHDFVVRKKVAFFGVGGGYLRAATPREAFKTLVAHGSQLLIARVLFPGSRKVYFPQSIGPLNYGEKIFYWLLRGLDVLFCRDEKTMRELSGLNNKRRSPDLVVDKILEKESWQACECERAEVIFVFRDLPENKKSATYIKRLRELLMEFPESRLLVQSMGRGNDDISFYRREFPEYTCITKGELLLSNSFPIVVSVRLHGSLEAILEGCPSIHLSYERKGISAYKDLGLDDYVFHVDSFSSDEVVRAIKSLQADRSRFFACIRRASNSYSSQLQILEP